MIHLEDLTADAAVIDTVAVLLYESFREHWPNAWPTLDAARAEVMEALTPERINRLAVTDEGRVVGWVGGLPQYDGHVWEVHPLVVAAAYRKQSIGRMLMQDLEAHAAARGGLTLFLGTDDEDEMTSVAGIDLYPDPLAQLARIENRRGHPFTFYQKVGFALVGIVPDANGWGKPDIYMAKRIGHLTQGQEAV